MYKFVLFLAIVGIFSIGAMAVYKFSNKEPVVQQEYDRSEHILQRVKVIKADEYDLTLVDGRHIHAFLQAKAIPAAYKEVIRFVNTADYAKAVIIDETQGELIVDIVLTIKQSEVRSTQVSLTDWLRNKKLLWEKP